METQGVQMFVMYVHRVLYKMARRWTVVVQAYNKGAFMCSNARNAAFSNFVRWYWSSTLQTSV